MPERAQDFNRLSQQAAKCQVCPDLADQPAVLSLKNGSLSAEVVFVAEAPGRLGAGRTGIPFSGDKSGENFEILINHAGWTRDDVFITNAALCNPLKDGSNRRPTALEIRNCSPFLKAVLNTIKPKIVVTLGGVGLTAVNILLGTKYILGKTVALPIQAPEFILFPLYHPSPRVTHWRRTLPRQKQDFRKIVSALKSLTPKGRVA